jgi:hypothetical protein
MLNSAEKRESTRSCVGLHIKLMLGFVVPVQDARKNDNNRPLDRLNIRLVCRGVATITFGDSDKRLIMNVALISSAILLIPSCSGKAEASCHSVHHAEHRLVYTVLSNISLPGILA